MKESFLIFKAFYAPIETLSDEDLGKLFRCIFLYQIEGKEPDSKDAIFMAFQFFKNQFRLDDGKYEKVVNRNRTNGLNGGRPITQDNPKNPLGLKKPKKADNDNDNDNVISKDINKRVNKILFTDSYLFKKESFKSEFPEWNSKKLLYYYEAAIAYSNEGNKYANWKSAINNWAKRDELQGKLSFIEKSTKHSGLI